MKMSNRLGSKLDDVRYCNALITKLEHKTGALTKLALAQDIRIVATVPTPINMLPEICLPILHHGKPALAYSDVWNYNEHLVSELLKTMSWKEIAARCIRYVNTLEEISDHHGRRFNSKECKHLRRTSSLMRGTVGHRQLKASVLDNISVPLGVMKALKFVPAKLTTPRDERDIEVTYISI